nr:protein white-like [Leptinotarsa decemlineata]
MDEERTPLLVPEASGKKASSNSNNSESSSGASSIKLGYIGIPFYGTELGSKAAKVVPIGERITYTWNNINAFAASNDHIRKKYICCGESIATGGQKKHILKNVIGAAYPGELLAILGSSGAGKTTLLNALTFRPTREVVVTGTRCVNGIPINSGKLTSLSAYVQQDDLFIACMTVREQLIFQALVRMDKSISYEQRVERVEEVLSEVSNLVMKKSSKIKISLETASRRHT